MFKTMFFIGAGGFIGSISRYLMTRATHYFWPHSFPLGTFAVNITGCLLIGIIMGLSFQSTLSTQMRLLLATGFCGGFTTFSTYSLEIFEIYRKGEPGISMLYMMGSIVLGILSVWAGLWLARSMASG